MKKKILFALVCVFSVLLLFGCEKKPENEWPYDIRKVDMGRGLDENGRYAGVRALDYVTLPEDLEHPQLPASLLEEAGYSPYALEGMCRSLLETWLIENSVVSQIPQQLVEEQNRQTEVQCELYFSYLEAQRGKSREELLAEYGYDSFADYVAEHSALNEERVRNFLIIQAAAESLDLTCTTEDTIRYYLSGDALEEQLYYYGENAVMQMTMYHKVRYVLYEKLVLV